jgi:glycosyltransferase involved in cell wall biosynthesis
MMHSVVIPAHNASNYILKCLDSVLHQLNSHDEIIIVDDGSTDNTLNIIKELRDSRIQVYRHPHNLGIAAARNTALQYVSGDYIHFLDHDDLWPPNRISIFNAFSVDPNSACLISGWVEHFYCNTLSSEAQNHFLLPEPQAASLPGSVVMTLPLIKKIGFFDTSLSSGEFVDYLSKAMDKSVTWIKSDDIFFCRRIHGHNHTLRDSQASASYLKVIRQHLNRQRQA